MILLRRLLSLGLVMTMVLTSSAMASMRGSDDGAQRIVICTGFGPQMVLIGADGEQVEPAPICPDCTMVLEAGPLPFLALAVSQPRLVEAATSRKAQGAVGPSCFGAQPRAPPVLAL